MGQNVGNWIWLFWVTFGGVFAMTYVHVVLAQRAKVCPPSELRNLLVTALALVIISIALSSIVYAMYDEIDDAASLNPTGDKWWWWIMYEWLTGALFIVTALLSILRFFDIWAWAKSYATSRTGQPSVFLAWLKSACTGASTEDQSEPLSE